MCRCFTFSLLLSLIAAGAEEFTWTGLGDGASWKVADNWEPSSGVPGAGDEVTLTSAQGESTIVIDRDTPLRSLAFEPGALNACRLEGAPLALADGASVSFEILPGDVGSGKTASQTIASELRLSGRVRFSNQNRHYLGGEKLQLAGPMSGTGSLVVGGVRHGIVQLTGDNSRYSGAFFVETGSLMLSHSGALGSGREAVTLNGGAVVIGARVSTTHDFLVAADADWDSHGPNGTHDGTITIKPGATLTVKNGGGNTMSWRGVIAGEGDLKFSAHGTTFAGDRANTLSGTTTIGGTRGATIMARGDGVDVVAGPLVMVERGALRWCANEQIADTVSVTFAVNCRRSSWGGIGRLWSARPARRCTDRSW